MEKFWLCENDILDISIFGNSDFKFNIFKINDIWYENNKTFVDNQTIFNRLDDKRNSISEWGEIKKNTRNLIKELRSDDNEKMKKILYSKS